MKVRVTPVRLWFLFAALILLTRSTHLAFAAAPPDATIALMLLGGMWIRRWPGFAGLMAVVFAADCIATGTLGRPGLLPEPGLRRPGAGLSCGLVVGLVAAREAPAGIAAGLAWHDAGSKRRRLRDLQRLLVRVLGRVQRLAGRALRCGVSCPTTRPTRAQPSGTWRWRGSCA